LGHWRPLTLLRCDTAAVQGNGSRTVKGAAEPRQPPALRLPVPLNAPLSGAPCAKSRWIALNEKGVLSGKRVERSEIGALGEFDHLSDAERERLPIERAAELGFALVPAISDG
jgi:hypothetical protein